LGYIIRKIVFVLVIVGMIVVMNVLSAYSAVPASQINKSQTESVMRGDDSTVTALATQSAINNVAYYGRIIAKTIIAVFSIILLGDIIFTVIKIKRGDLFL